MRNFLQLFFVVMLELFFSKADAQKIESPFNEIAGSVNMALTGGETESRTGFGLGVYHTPKGDSVNGFVFGFEYNNVQEFKKYTDTHSHFGDNEENVLYEVVSISFLAGHRFNFGTEVKAFLDLGGYLEVGEGIFPGVLVGAGIKIPVLKCQLILKPQVNITPFIGSGKYNESIYHSCWRIALGLKFF